MTLAEVVDGHQRRQAHLAAATASFVAARWSAVDPTDVTGTWALMLPDVLATVTAAQTEAAQAGGAYTAAAAAEQGIQTTARVDPTRFAGIASDGRPLDTLLSLPAGQTVGRMARGVPAEQAMRWGRFATRTFTETQILDAGRTAAQAATVATPELGGYRRQLRGQTNCSRCVILAGKWYRWNRGFNRHPRCDCVHVPSTGPKSDVAGLEGFDPKAHFESLSGAEQDRIFGADGAKAIRDGADMNQVVNSRRGMRTTNMYGRKVRTTTEGTTVRGSAGRRLQRAGADIAKVQGERVRRVTVPRLTPEQIYADAADRDDAVRLLRRFGYLA